MMPGCNMTNYPKGTDGRQCCPSKPKSFSRSTAEACKTKCPKTENRTEMMCCWSKCMIDQSGVFNADGTLNQAAAVAKLLNSTKQVSAWEPIVKALVEKCVADGKTQLTKFIYLKSIKLSSKLAPAMVEAFKNKTNHTDPCGNALNKAIAHCIEHELFVQCPEAEKNTTNANCTKLFDFAKSCPAYPFFGHGHGKCDKGGKSGEHGKQGGKGGKSGEQGKQGGKPEGKNGKQKDNTAAPASGTNPPAANGANPASGNTQSKGNQASNNKGNQASNNKGNQAAKPTEKPAKPAENKANNKQPQGKQTTAPPKKN